MFAIGKTENGPFIALDCLSAGWASRVIDAELFDVEEADAFARDDPALWIVPVIPHRAGLWRTTGGRPPKGE